MQFGLWVGKGIMGWRVLIKNTEIMHEKSTFILPPSTGRRNEREGGVTYMDSLPFEEKGEDMQKDVLLFGQY